MFKRLIAILCIAVLLLGLVACAQDTAADTGANTPDDASSDASADAAGGDASDASSDDVSSDSSSAETVKVGLYGPASGASATYWYQEQWVFDYMVEKINANGGLAGKQIEVVQYDTTTSTEEAAKIAEKLANVDKVNIVIGGGMSVECLAANDTLTEANCFVLNQAISDAIIDPVKWPTIYRCSFNTTHTVPAALNSLEMLGLTKGALLYSQTEASISTANAFKDAAAGAGLEIIAEETWESTDTDYSAQAINIAASNPEFVYLASESDYIGSVLKQLRQYGYDGIVVSKEEIAVEQMPIAGDAVNGFVFPSLYVSWKDLETAKPNVNEQMYAFLEEYYEEFGEMPVSIWAYECWDEMNMLWEAANTAGDTSTEALCAAFDQMKYPGIGGMADFTDGDHEAHGPADFYSYIYENGELMSLEQWMKNHQ